MGMMTSLMGPGTDALPGEYAQEKGVCAGGFGVGGGLSGRVNAAPEWPCVVAFDMFEEVEGSVQVEGGRGEGQSPDPVVGSLRWESVLVVHWGVLGSTGAHHWKVEKEPCCPGGWRWELRERRRDGI